MSDDITKQDTFSKEYVHELRNESAAYRTKLRDAEATITQYQEAAQEEAIDKSITLELSKRNVSGVEPRWVDITENQSISEAVDKFLTDHTQFTPTPVQESDIPVPAKAGAQGAPAQGAPAQGAQGAPVAGINGQNTRPTQQPMNTQQTNTNNNSGVRPPDWAAIKADPISRAKLRDMYRGMISSSSNTGPLR